MSSYNSCTLQVKAGTFPLSVLWPCLKNKTKKREGCQNDNSRSHHFLENSLVYASVFLGKMSSKTPISDKANLYNSVSVSPVTSLGLFS